MQSQKTPCKSHTSPTRLALIDTRDLALAPRHTSFGCLYGSGVAGGGAGAIAHAHVEAVDGIGQQVVDGEAEAQARVHQTCSVVDGRVRSCNNVKDLSQHSDTNPLDELCHADTSYHACANMHANRNMCAVPGVVVVVGGAVAGAGVVGVQTKLRAVKTTAWVMLPRK